MLKIEAVRFAGCGAHAPKSGASAIPPLSRWLSL
jgi:hypothetical protein